MALADPASPRQERHWGRRDLALCVALLVIANIGMIGRQVEAPVDYLITVLGATAAALLVWWLAMSPAGLRIPATWVPALLIAAWIGLAAIALLVPESVDLRADRDDALDLAVPELLSGRDPWAVSTQIHPTHHPSPGLGGIVLAAPFVALMGDSAWQNLFWLGLAMVLLLRRAGAHATVAAVLLVLASPTFWSEWIFHSDLLTLAIKLSVAMLWGLQAMQSGGWPSYILSALLFGVVLSDRFLLLALAVLLAVAALRAVPIRRSLPWLALAGATTVTFMAIPWLLAPGYREQLLLNVAKGSEAYEALPNAGLILGGTMLIAAVVAGWVVRTDAALMGCGALIVFLVVLTQILLYSVAAGAPEFSGSLAVAYTGVLLIFGTAGLVLPGNPDRTRDESSSSAIHDQ